MKCLIITIALTVLCVFRVNASPTINTEDWQGPHLSAKTANIDEKNYVKRSITTKQYQLVDVPARINRFVDNANARNSKYFKTSRENTVQFITQVTARNTECAPNLEDVQLIEETAINNTKKCYQPLKEFSENYPTNLKDLHISEEIYNIFQSCQPKNKKVILNTFDCVNATMKKQQIFDQIISSLLETIKNAEIAVKNCKICEKRVYDKQLSSILKMAEDVDKCVTANKVPSSNDNSEDKKVTELPSMYQLIQASLPINQLSTIAHQIGNLTFDSRTPNPWLDDKITEVTAEGPAYSHCIAGKSFVMLMYFGINDALKCHKPLEDVSLVLGERVGNIRLISDKARTIYENCHQGSQGVTLSSMECVTTTMAKQHIVEPKLNLLFETMVNIGVVEENMKKCQLRLAKELETIAIKMTDGMDDCVIITLVWNLFQ